MSKREIIFTNPLAFPENADPESNVVVMFNVKVSELSELFETARLEGRQVLLKLFIDPVVESES